MKIKAVCERTNLTDRTIRYYIEEGLISPAFTENYLGRKSFDFSEDNISELNDIVVLRSFEFSIEEIRQILDDPFLSISIIQAVKERVKGEFINSEKKISVLSSLNGQEVYTAHELARELSKLVVNIQSEEKIERRVGNRIREISKGVLFFLAVWLPSSLSTGIIISLFLYYENPIVDHTFLILTLLLFIPSLLWMISPRMVILRNRIFQTVILFLCILCIPLSIFTAYSSVNECEHNFKELSIKIEASCSAEGKIVKQCNICSKIITETVDRLQHSIVIDHEIAATCTKTGLTRGSRCGVCGVVLAKQEILPKTEHTYAKIVAEPTCGKDGMVTLVCYCGESYRESTIFCTEKHDFIKNNNKGYICSFCGLEVCEYGYVDGSRSGRSSDVRYYITGTTDTAMEQERMLVIFGSGEMPEPKNSANYLFRESVYVDEIKTIIICEGVTSIAEGAFEASKTNDYIFGNPFRSVTSFIVKGNLLTLDPHSDRMSGIECDITYQRN